MTATATSDGVPVPPDANDPLLSDEGLCAADAEMSSLELNDALAPLLGFSGDRNKRIPGEDEEIREYKNAAFERACPERAS
ncbi:hypothetical protein SERN_2007 [Serinibacter arcticus]|uniref:Uncharacterized protein n=1 Tax=Serinibacter arcticus TaxID=1655435 RepID=A0A4Z1DXR2_9MICO|nr:hypothetical protein SERN_2007 [Serinibacter arcticus]